MKTRVMSAIIAMLIFIPVIWQGGFLFHIAVFILALLALHEFIGAKEQEKELPIFIKLVSYIMMVLILVAGIKAVSLTFTLDIRVISGVFLIYLIPAVLYHNQKIYSIVDAFYMIGGLFFLGIAFYLMIFVRNTDLSLFIYLFCISIFTDTFAYLTGLFIGRHKLLESISPKKTIEGMIGGTLMGVIISSWFYYTVIDPEVTLSSILITSLFLSILGQFGDLIFSSIKRCYKIKDFSNIMPGHGGILDRLDSIIFILFGFMFFMMII